MPGITPFVRIRYPLSGEVVDAAAEQAMATDMDVAMDGAMVLNANYTSRPGAQLINQVGPSIVKNTLTTVSFTQGNATFWNVANPTRLTAPAAGLYLATGNAGILFSSGVSQFKLMVAKNGGTAAPNIQSNSNPNWETNQIFGAVTAMWLLAAGDFLELKVIWQGATAGPLNLATPATLGIQTLIYT